MIEMRPGAYLHHLQIQSPDPLRLAQFYAETLDMTLEEQPQGRWLCEGPGRLISFCEGDRNVIDRIGFACHDSDSLREFRRRAEAARCPIEGAANDMLGEGGFSIKDPNGNCIAFGLAARHGVAARAHRGPLQHITLMSRNIEAIEDFYAGVLGFAISDRVMDEGQLMTTFLRSNHEHHTLACFKGPRDGIDHHSYEAGEWSVLRDWADHFARNDVLLNWGPGRHGPGNNLFMFIDDPDGNWIELSAELEVVHDRETKNWAHHPRTLNQWGPARMRMKREAAE